MSEIVPVVATPGDYVWARGPYRAQVWRSGAKWKYRVWDVVSVELGGSGTTIKGAYPTLAKAKRFALAVLEAMPGVLHL